MVEPHEVRKRTPTRIIAACQFSTTPPFLPAGIYSTVAEPASLALAEPVTDMLGSTAIISARMSRIGYGSVSSDTSHNTAFKNNLNILSAQSCHKC